MNNRSLIILGLALVLLASCKVSVEGQTNFRLAYTNPREDGYRLLKNPASTGNRLILDLYGPANTRARGIAFFLTADASQVDWTVVDESTQNYSRPGNVFELGTSPRLYGEKRQDGHLQVGLFQKTGDAALDNNRPLVSIALRPAGHAALGPAALGETAGKQSVVLNADGTITPAVLHIGTVVVQ